MRPRRPQHSGLASACIFLNSVFFAALASAQNQYGDSAWTGQNAPTLQQGRSANLPTAGALHNASQSTSAPQAQQPVSSPQHIVQQGYSNSPSHIRTPAYPGLPNSAVVPASAEAPEDSKPSFNDDTGIPAGQPVSTGTELTPINGADRNTAADQSSGGVLQTIVSVGSSLLIVGGLFFGLVWVYRKTANTTIGSGLPKGVVNVLGRAPIAARQQMVLVRFGHKLVLVSVVQGDARAISEITDPLEVDRLTGLCESAKPDSSVQSFRSFLSEGSKA